MGSGASTIESPNNKNNVNNELNNNSYTYKSDLEPIYSKRI